MAQGQETSKFVPQNTPDAPAPPPVPRANVAGQGINPDGAGQTYFLPQPDKPIPAAEAQGVFDRMSAIRDIAFGYATDGCYARAHLMCTQLVENGETPSKAWAFQNSMKERLTVDVPGGGRVEWWYHVAPTLPVQMPDGQVHHMVFDPSLFNGPATLDKWAEVMRATPDAQHLMITPLGAPLPMLPGDYTPYQVTTAQTHQDALTTMQEYLPQQGERRVFSGNLPEFVAAHTPEGAPAVALPAPIHLGAPYKPPPKLLPEGTTTAGAVGLVTSTMGLVNAVHTGDKVEGTIAGANMAVSGLQLTDGLMTAAGRSAPLLKGAGKFVPGLNVALTAADGVYQIEKEDTQAHKAERATAVGATVTTGLVLGTAAATTGEAAAITTGVTGVLGTGALGTGAAAVTVAAAPVVLTVVAVGAVAYTGDKVIEAKRAWDDVDQMTADNARPSKFSNTPGPDGKPSVLNYRHIVSALLDSSPEMKDQNMTGSFARDQRGRFKIDEVRKIDLSNPRNMAELERVIDARIARDDKTISENSSFLPKWTRIFSADSVDKLSTAEYDRAGLSAAKQELQQYRQELRTYDAAHPVDPAATGVTPVTPPPAPAPKKPGQQLGAH